MYRSFARPAMLALTYAALAIGVTVFPATPVQGVTLTVIDPNCAGYTLAGNTLTCQSLGCSIASSAGVSISPVGTPTTLTATCAPPADPNKYTWSAAAANAAGCPNFSAASLTTTINVLAPLAAVANCVYQVSATNSTLVAGQVASGQAFITLAYSAVPPPPPPQPTGCMVSITSNPSPLTSAVGTAMPLVSGCLPNTVTYTWTRNGSAWTGMTTPNPTDNLPANAGTSALTFTYVPTVCNGATCLTLAPGVAATQPGTGGGGGGGPISCPNYTLAPGAKIVALTANWAAPTRLYTSDAGGFGPHDVLVVQFTTGPTKLDNVYGQISGAEWQSPPSSRFAMLSATPCDFTTGLPALFNSSGPGNSVSVYYALGAATFYPNLQPNTTYYLNVINSPAPTTCQTNGACDMYIDFHKPSGL